MEGSRSTLRRLVPLLVLMTALGSGSPTAEEVEVLDNSIDPSGGWNSPIGALSLMHTGNTLSFSYSAVYGSTAHICDGAGVAGLVGRDSYQWVDEEGTLAFVLSEDGVTMEVVDGVVSFCGAGWFGDIFSRDGFKSTEICVVEAKRSHFAVVEAFSPEQRRAYVIEGDRLEVAPVRNEGGEDWALARFVGPTSTTVGLLKLADLNCWGSEADRE